jgi:hypothetical protein
MPIVESTSPEAIEKRWSEAIEKTEAILAKTDSTLTTVPAAPTAPLVELKRKLADVAALKTVDVYYVKVKEGAMEIVAKVGNQFVTMKATVSEVVGMQLDKLKEAVFTVRGVVDTYSEKTKAVVKVKTMVVQRGYIYVSAEVNGKLVMIKGQVSEMGDAVRQKLADGVDKVGEYTSPVKSKAIALYDSSKAKAGTVLQPLQPYYMKVHDGVASIVATVGDKVVIVQLRISEVHGGIQVRTSESLMAARAAVEKLSTPVIVRLISLKDGTSTRVEHITISFTSGIMTARTAIGDRLMTVHARSADILGSVSMKASDSLAGVKITIADVVTKLVAFASRTQGIAYNKVRVLQTKCTDGVLYVTCQIGDRTVVLRAKISEVLELIQTKQKALYTSGKATVLDAYGGVKDKMLLAAEAVKTKSLEVGTNVRTIAANPKAQITAASAAGGAVALGASGGAMGLMTGAGCGVVLAPFTFGLSIPLGAGAGLCIGTAAGGTAGLVTGGAAGYGAHKHKDGISNGLSGALSKVKACKSKAALYIGSTAGGA